MGGNRVKECAGDNEDEGRRRLVHNNDPQEVRTGVLVVAFSSAGRGNKCAISYDQTGFSGAP